jgi:hypothetical protein
MQAYQNVPQVLSLFPDRKGLKVMIQWFQLSSNIRRCQSQELENQMLLKYLKKAAFDSHMRFGEIY